MGANCQIVLPHNVRVEDVATVMAILAGSPPEKNFFGPADSMWSTRSGGFAENTTIIGMVAIRFADRYAHYFFEPDEYNGRLISCRSTPFWCAMANRLVDFFGGVVDYNDCDDSDIDYEVEPKSDIENKPTEGEEWYTFHQRILDLKAVTRDEIAAMAGKAGYNDDDRNYTFDEDGHLIFTV